MGNFLTKNSFFVCFNMILYLLTQLVIYCLFLTNKNYNSTNYLTSHVEKLIHYQVTVNSHFEAVSEDDFQTALIQYSENKVKCALNKTVGVTITCYPHVEKDAQSLLKLQTHWFQLVSTPAPISRK